MKEINDLLASLDAIIAFVDHYDSLNLQVPFGNIGEKVNAMSLLTDLVGKFYNEEEIVEWLSHYLIYILPVLEIAVKGVILSNLKLDISCNVDPWIPEVWRQQLSPSGDILGADKNPCMIPIATIDYKNIFRTNPTTEKGKEYYYKSKMEYLWQSPSNSLVKIQKPTFAEVYEELMAHRNTSSAMLYNETDTINSIGDIVSQYQLARADDMNSFLWFVMHHGIYTNVNSTQLQEKLPQNAVTIATAYQEITQAETDIDTDMEVYLSGDVITTQRPLNSTSAVTSTNYLLCYDGERMLNDKGNKISYYSKIIPCSNAANSYNWYVNRKNYGKLLADVDFERNYADEFPLCNISCRNADGHIDYNPTSDSYFQVRVLPRPMLHYRKAFWKLEENGIIAPIPFIKILFDETGVPNKKGFYTVRPKEKNGRVEKPLYYNGYGYYTLVDRNGNDSNYILQAAKSNYSVYHKPEIIKIVSWKENTKYTVFSSGSTQNGTYQGSNVLFTTDGIIFERYTNKTEGMLVIKSAKNTNGFQVLSGVTFDGNKITTAKEVKQNPLSYLTVDEDKGVERYTWKGKEVEAYKVWTYEQRKYLPDKWIITNGGKIYEDVEMQVVNEEDVIGKNDIDFINDCLYQCYKGLSIYEFNYDFVMGMHLFDAKTVAYRILRTLLEFRLGLPKVSMTETLYQMRISNIILEIMNSDAYEVKDCFFEFSNEKYASMLREAELRQSHKMPFFDNEKGYSANAQEVLDILNEYSDTATLSEREDVITRAFNKAVSVEIQNEVLPQDKLNISMNFILEALKLLGVAIFETLISPKMLLLFEINKRLMGEIGSKYPTLNELFAALASMITAIITEIMEMIIAELMAFLMKRIGQLLIKLASMLALEQLTYYRELLRKLIECLKFKFPLFGKRSPLDTQLDVVQYADIDEIETPKIDEC